jgi:hypothetical protein
LKAIEAVTCIQHLSRNSRESLFYNQLHIAVLVGHFPAQWRIIFECKLTATLWSEPDSQEILNQMPYMHGIQKFQIIYDNIRKEREQESKAIIDQIYAEILAKAKMKRQRKILFKLLMPHLDGLQNRE